MKRPHCVSTLLSAALIATIAFSTAACNDDPSSCPDQAMAAEEYVGLTEPTSMVVRGVFRLVSKQDGGASPLPLNLDAQIDFSTVVWFATGDATSNADLSNTAPVRFSQGVSRSVLFSIPPSDFTFSCFSSTVTPTLRLADGHVIRAESVELKLGDRFGSTYDNTGTEYGGKQEIELVADFVLD